MRRFNLSDLALRLLANMAEVLVIYIVFNLLRWFLLRPIWISVVYLLVVSAAATILSRYGEYRQFDENKQQIAALAGGIVIGIVFSVVSSGSAGVVELAISFILFLVIWGRAIKTSNTDLYGIFSVEGFYRGLGIIGAADLFIYISKVMVQQRGIAGSCTVLYIIISLYLLSTLKAKALNMKENGDRTISFDLAATVLVILAALAFSSNRVLGGAMALLKLVYMAVVYIVGIIAIPLGYAAVFLLGKIRFLFEAFWHVQLGGNVNDADNNPMTYEEFVGNPNIDRIIHLMGYILLFIIIGAVLYYIYKAAVRYGSSKHGQDYEESREFLFGLRQAKEGLPKQLGKLRDKLSGMTDRLLFGLRASNREKIRFEYKRFLGLLYSRQLAAEGHTAHELCCSLSSDYPQAGEYIRQLTCLYEDVRYGTREPSAEELAQFRVCLKKITNELEIDGKRLQIA